MYEFILKLVGIVCATIVSALIIIMRKDDIDSIALWIALILEVIAIAIIYIPTDIIMTII